jgi:hypothetical protein
VWADISGAHGPVKFIAEVEVDFLGGGGR